MNVDTSTGEILPNPVSFARQEVPDDFDADQADLMVTAKLDLESAADTLGYFLNGYGIMEEPEEFEQIDPSLAELVGAIRQLLPAVRELIPLAQDFFEDIIPPSQRGRYGASSQGFGSYEPASLDSISDLYDEDAWSWDDGPYSAAARSVAYDGLDEGYVYEGTPLALDDSIGDSQEHDFEAANRAILAELSKNSEETRGDRESALKEIMGEMSGGIAL